MRLSCWNLVWIQCVGVIHVAATHCTTLQHTATYRKTLQHTATQIPVTEAILLNLNLNTMHRCHTGGCNTLQHTAPHFNTQQHTATQCITLQHKYLSRRLSCWILIWIQRISVIQVAATYCTTLHHTATHCNTLHHTATHYNTPQHTATQIPVTEAILLNLDLNTMHRCHTGGWNTRHHTAPHGTTLHHTAPHCNTLQHTATHCNTNTCHWGYLAESWFECYASVSYRWLQHTAPHCTTQ